MIYLASPYSNDPQSNYRQMIDVGRRLLRRAPPPTIFSPVIHFHPIGQNVPYESMMDICLDILHHCDDLIVVTLPEWENSKGVAAEIEYWAPMNYILMDPVTLVGKEMPNPVTQLAPVK